MEKYLKLVNMFTLLGILAVLILILINLPQVPAFPNKKAFLDAMGNKERLQELASSIPFVEVRGTVSVDVENYQLDVNVTNSELDVRIRD
jgi:hypothetical protein